MNYRQLLISPQTFYAYYKKTMIERRNRDKDLRLGLFVEMQNCSFGRHNYINNRVSLYNVTVGDHSYINANSIIAYTSIGKFCSIANNVQIGLGQHPSHFISTHPAFYSNQKAFLTFADKGYFKESEKTVIENDVWIGNNAIIVGGITVSNGAVIAAGSVVTKDVPPYAIVGGVPAKIIRRRFSEDKIEKLLQYQWWNKDDEWFQANYKQFHDADGFMKFIEQEQFQKS